MASITPPESEHAPDRGKSMLLLITAIIFTFLVIIAAERIAIRQGESLINGSMMARATIDYQGEINFVFAPVSEEIIEAVATDAEQLEAAVGATVTPLRIEQDPPTQVPSATASPTPSMTPTPTATFVAATAVPPLPTTTSPPANNPSPPPDNPNPNPNPNPTPTRQRNTPLPPPPPFSDPHFHADDDVHTDTDNDGRGHQCAHSHPPRNEYAAARTADTDAATANTDTAAHSANGHT